ncbi:MAG: vWA domain-containing protein [Phycisphaerales bacterium]|jgi:Ca-activated chloride channel family protein
MTFTHPWVLLLLCVPVLLLWVVLGKRVGLVMPFDHRTHARRRWLASVLGAFELVPLGILALVIAMLAGPKMMQQPKAERSLTNVQLCLDVSGSMSGQRYELASKAIREFTKEREGDAFGLTLFGSEQIRWVPLTKDLGAIRNALPFADPNSQPVHMGGTAIAAALRFCKDNMLAEAAPGDRLIIMVSDGDSSDLDNGESEKVASELREAGITLYHIHVAEGEDIPSEVVDMARQTGGDAMAATDPASIKEVFRHIDRMKPATFRPVGALPLDAFAPFGIAALALLGLHGLGLLGLRYTPW